MDFLAGGTAIVAAAGVSVARAAATVVAVLTAAGQRTARTAHVLRRCREALPQAAGGVGHAQDQDERNDVQLHGFKRNRSS